MGQICPIVLHLFWILSPGFENNHSFKCWSDDDYEQIETFKKNYLEVDLSNSTYLFTDEGETKGKPEGEPEPETESLNMASFVRDLSKAKDEIKHNVNLSKKELHA